MSQESSCTENAALGRADPEGLTDLAHPDVEYLEDPRWPGSGVPVDAPLGMVLDFRDGKISRMRFFLDHGEALKAAGLE